MWILVSRLHSNTDLLFLQYFVILVIVVVMELAAAGLVWKHANGEKFQEFLTESIKDQIDKSKLEDGGASARFVELLQLHLECCGGYDKNDYHMDDIPQSCSSDRTNNVFIHGCGENIRRYLEQKAGTIGGISLGLVLVQILCLIFTGVLFCTLREDSKNY
ncbi:tetraspanin-1-like [Stegodyphus dumicola]|uniref:tetraspanin-1-like n=1 Tax=Stegodyphus dumicola TaxID=202533 RepID=UPI0015AADE30|nr:tetraspanin-1-like [Stegodyphus dumicola]